MHSGGHDIVFFESAELPDILDILPKLEAAFEGEIIRINRPADLANQAEIDGKGVLMSTPDNFQFMMMGAAMNTQTHEVLQSLLPALSGINPSDYAAGYQINASRSDGGTGSFTVAYLQQGTRTNTGTPGSVTLSGIGPVDLPEGSSVISDSSGSSSGIDVRQLTVLVPLSIEASKAHLRDAAGGSLAFQDMGTGAMAQTGRGAAISRIMMTPMDDDPNATMISFMISSESAN